MIISHHCILSPWGKLLLSPLCGFGGVSAMSTTKLASKHVLLGTSTVPRALRCLQKGAQYVLIGWDFNALNFPVKKHVWVWTWYSQHPLNDFSGFLVNPYLLAFAHSADVRDHPFVGNFYDYTGPSWCGVAGTGVRCTACPWLQDLREDGRNVLGVQGLLLMLRSTGHWHLKLIYLDQNMDEWSLVYSVFSLQHW